MRMCTLLVGCLIAALASSVAAVPVRPPTKDRPKEVVKDEKKLEGTWEVAAMEYNGREYPPEIIQRRGLRLMIAGDRYIKETQLRGMARQIAYTFKLDPTKKPKTIDVFLGGQRGGTIQAIYKLDGDRLIVCEGRAGQARPTEFKTQMGSRTYLYTWKRVEVSK